MTRKSKREIDAALDDIGKDHEPLTLVEMLSYNFETVDEERDLVRVEETGEIRKDPTGPGSIRDILEPEPPAEEDVDA